MVAQHLLRFRQKEKRKEKMKSGGKSMVEMYILTYFIWRLKKFFWTTLISPLGKLFTWINLKLQIINFWPNSMKNREIFRPMLVPRPWRRPSLETYPGCPKWTWNSEKFYGPSWPFTLNMNIFLIFIPQERSKRNQDLFT